MTETAPVIQAFWPLARRIRPRNIRIVTEQAGSQATVPAGGLALSKATASVIRFRKSATLLTADEIAALRSAISGRLAVADDRGHESWAGLHGLPLPISGTHRLPLFLPCDRVDLF